MKTAKASIKLSEHVKADGSFAGWKKHVWGRVFYFGQNTPRREAEGLAAALVAQAKRLQESGHTSWTQHAIDDVMGHRMTQTPAKSVEALRIAPVRIGDRLEPTACLNHAPDPFPSTLNLYDGIKLYLAHLKSKVPHQLSESHYSRQVTSAEALKKVQADLPLAQVGFDWLTQAVSKFTARPISKKTGKPIAVETVRTQVKHLRCLCDYLADAGHWQECRRFSRIFRLKTTSLLTNRERAKKAEGVETYSVEELRVLWAAANEQQKLYLALGLNCGFTNVDIATLLLDHVQDGTIKRTRNKTAVLGQWELWPTTAKLLAARIAKTPANEEGLAMLSRESKPLVRYEGCMRLDSVRSTWLKLSVNKHVKGKARRMTFKTLRKTGSQMVFGVAGLEVAQTFLAHAPKSIAELHYLCSRDFGKLSKALKQVWEEQLSSWMVVEDKKGKAKKD